MLDVQSNFGPKFSCMRRDFMYFTRRESLDDLNVELSVKRFRFCPLLISARGQFKAKASKVIFFLGHWP